MKLALVLLCSVLAIAAGQVRFDGHEVLRTFPANREQMKKLDTLQEDYDFWTETRLGGPTDIQVSPENKQVIREFLTANEIRYEVMIKDVQALIQMEKLWNAKAADGTKMDWTSYHSVADIQAWVEEISAENSDISEVINIGTSHEGRPLKLIKIGRNSSPSKPAIFMDGGIHAREWIAPAIATYYINQLLTNQAAYQDILDSVDIYILPTFNVDGYEYTRLGSGSRLWRKTRQDHSNGAGCIGTDPNRNFDDHFGGDGTSTNKCSEIYHGPNAFSEPETRAMSNFILNANVNWQVYIALHSYAQMILYGWGWGYSYPPDVADLKSLGDQGNVALYASHQKRYDVGSVTDLLSPGAGGSDDWAKAKGGFKYSYTMEVRDTGAYGFVLPPNQIIPTGEETWAAIQVFARFIANKA